MLSGQAWTEPREEDREVEVSWGKALEVGTNLEEQVVTGPRLLWIVSMEGGDLKTHLRAGLWSWGFLIHSGLYTFLGFGGLSFFSAFCMPFREMSPQGRHS